MEQTAVEWLAEQITTVKWKMSDLTDRKAIIQQAKEMEKEQIKDAWDNGNQWEYDSSIRNSDEYYKETFKSE